MSRKYAVSSEIKKFAQTLYQKTKITPIEFELARRVLRWRSYVVNHNTEKGLFTYAEALEIADPGFPKWGKRVVEAAIAEMKPVISRLSARAAELPFEMRMGIAHVSHKAFDANILKNPPLTVEDAKRYVNRFDGYSGLYISLSVNGEILEAYNGIARREAEGKMRLVDLRQEGWERNKLLTSGDSVQKLISDKTSRA